MCDHPIHSQILVDHFHGYAPAQTMLCKQCKNAIVTWTLDCNNRVRHIVQLDKIHYATETHCWCNEKLKRGKCPCRNSSWHKQVDEILKKEPMCSCGWPVGVFHAFEQMMPQMWPGCMPGAILGKSHVANQEILIERVPTDLASAITLIQKGET